MSQRRLNSLVAPGIIAAAALFVSQAAFQLAHTPSGETTLEGTLEHLNIISLVVNLIVLMPATVAIGRLAQAPRATRAALTGMAALAAICTASAVNSGDLSFFPAVAIPANLMWFGGLIAFGVGLFRAGVVERRYAIALPLVWVALLPFSQVGGAIVAAVLLIVVTRRLGLLALSRGLRGDSSQWATRTSATRATGI